MNQQEAVDRISNTCISLVTTVVDFTCGNKLGKVEVTIYE